MTKDDLEETWQVATRDQPVWRDGISSYLSYLLIAVHFRAQQYNCVCVRDLGQKKVKFYPNMQHWGLDYQQLVRMGFSEYLSRENTYGYERVIGSDLALEKLTTYLQSLADTKAVAFAQALQAFEDGPGRETSQQVHPSGDKVPTVQQMSSMKAAQRVIKTVSNW